eukprot:365263-Chlamydomonas_euryale.AAC.16
MSTPRPSATSTAVFSMSAGAPGRVARGGRDASSEPAASSAAAAAVCHTFVAANVSGRPAMLPQGFAGALGARCRA